MAAHAAPATGWNPWLWAWVGSEDVANAHLLLMEVSDTLPPHEVYYLRQATITSRNAPNSRVSTSGAAMVNSQVPSTVSGRLPSVNQAATRLSTSCQCTQAARRHQTTVEFKEHYADRAGIKGTLSQAVRAFDMRRSRYIGLAKTHLQHVLSAAAMNVVRVMAWLTEPHPTPPRVSAFAALAASG